jgi:hypothetical protein
VQIQDEQFCSPIPGNLGAVCDNFLTSNQLILNEAQWIALQATWQSAGNATECTSSSTLGDIKGELEKLCSKTPCTYEQAQQVKTAVANIDRMIAMGQHPRVKGD